MKRFAPVLFAAFVFCACGTSAHLPVPGESGTVKNNLSAEYLVIGDEYFSLTKYDKAEEYYKRAMKNRKLYWSAYYKLGRTYAMSKKWQDARKVDLTLLKRDPDNLNIRLSLAYITAMEGKLSAAESVYDYLWKENPDNPDIIVNYINVLLAQKKADTAQEHLNELKEKFKDNNNIQTFEKKIEELRESENKNPPDSENSKQEMQDTADTKKS